MSLTKRLNRVPYGRVLFAFVVGVIIPTTPSMSASTLASVAVRSLAPLQPPWMVVCRRVPVSPPLFSLVR